MDPLCLISAIADRIQGPRQIGAMATVVAVSGSVPQRPGARIATFADGGLLGTIGGGAIEEEVVTLLREVMKVGAFVSHERHLTRDLGMCCGGAMKFFVEPLRPSPRLILFGAGHIAQPCALVAKAAGFQVVVVDDREELLTKERFPEARLCLEDGSEILKNKSIVLGPFDYVVICTHSHRIDEQILALCGASPPGYLGMIGSKRKVQVVRERVLQRHPDRDLARLHAPVGLDIGAREPGEIAVSIVAQLIEFRRNAEDSKSAAQQ